MCQDTQLYAAQVGDPATALSGCAFEKSSVSTRLDRAGSSRFIQATASKRAPDSTANPAVVTCQHSWQSSDVRLDSWPMLRRPESVTRKQPRSCSCCRRLRLRRRENCSPANSEVHVSHLHLHRCRRHQLPGMHPSGPRPCLFARSLVRCWMQCA